MMILLFLPTLKFYLRDLMMNLKVPFYMYCSFGDKYVK